MSFDILFTLGLTAILAASYLFARSRKLLDVFLLPGKIEKASKDLAEFIESNPNQLIVNHMRLAREALLRASEAHTPGERDSNCKLATDHIARARKVAKQLSGEHTLAV